MKNIIIGTAGHIDHGKTTLIKALTGKDTDRLKEEKKRGISIDLGFTFFDLPSGKRAGIIDVPGHERFIRNMLAGVGGMDIVMLVVAADEGVMPQTKEHLDIISLLNIKNGMIVITKASLVDDEWIQLVCEDIRERVKGTFLENAEMLVVDSLTGYGLENLIHTIDRLTEETEGRDIQAPARMPIDRVFTITGFGTVVTGTLTEGKILLEDTLEILPLRNKVRVRNIQVHGKSVETAYAGQRVAMNLANVKKEEIKRGDVLAQLNSMETTMMIDARIRLLKDASRTIKNRDRVRLYHGSSEILARIILLEKEEVLPEESTYVQFRLEEPTAVRKGDPIVIRFYSPMETIGGAIVIDGNPSKHKRFDKKVIEELSIKEKGSPEDILEQHIETYSKQFPDISFLAKLTGQQISDVQRHIDQLQEKKKVVVLEKVHVIHAKYYEKIRNCVKDTLKEYHHSNPLKEGILKEELKSRIFPKNKNKVVDALLDMLEKDQTIKVKEKYVSLYDFTVMFNERQEMIKTRLEGIFLENAYATPTIEDVIKQIPYDRREVEQVFDAILGNELVKVSQDIIVHKKAYHEAKGKVEDYIRKNGSISAAEFRDLLNTSRKYAVAILEFFDNNKITKRIDDKRVLY